MAGSIDFQRFQPYLQSLLNEAVSNSSNEQEFYTPTQAELPLQVQTCALSIEQGRSHQLAEQKREQMEVLKGLRAYATNHVLLVGKPGSGKSTALKRLRWEEAKKVQESSEVEIPVLIKLRSCRDCSVLDLIQKALRRSRFSCEEIEELLFDRQLLLLFDGLNELPNEKAWQEVADFLTEFADAPMIFTTRELGAGTQLGIEKKLEMMPLTEPQMRQFIDKRLPGQAEVLLRQMQDRLRDLAETPLLLQMLCDVFQYEQKIPQNRGELFRKFAQEYDRIKHRGVITASPGFLDFRDDLLKQLAVTMMQGSGEPTDFLLQIDRAQAVQIFEQFLAGRVTDPGDRARKYLDDLVKFHLLQQTSNPNQIGFHHQLFQEYYAAEWLLLQLPNISDEQLKYYFLNYLKWTEAIGMALSLTDENTLEIHGKKQSVRVVDSALQIDLIFGARLIAKVQAKFQLECISLINTLTISSLTKVQLLHFTGSRQAIPLLTQHLNNVDYWVCSRAATAIQEIDSVVWQEINQSGKGYTRFITFTVDESEYEQFETSISTMQLISEWESNEIREFMAKLANSELIDIDAQSIFKILLSLEESDESLKNFYKVICEGLTQARENFNRSTIAKIGQEGNSKHLPELQNLLNNISNEELSNTIFAVEAIQKHSKFYNYQEANRTPPPLAVKSIFSVEALGSVIMHFHEKAYVAGNVEGDQVIYTHKQNLSGDSST